MTARARTVAAEREAVDLETSGPKRVRFTAEQKRELHRLGVPEQAIARLEQEAMPQVRRFVLQRPPRRRDVLAELRGLEDSMRSARDAIERFQDWTHESPPLRYARAAVPGGEHPQIRDGIRLHRASMALADALDAITEAIERLPAGPTRHQVASPRVVELLHDTLKVGMIAAGLDPGTHPIRPSASPTSRFRKFIGICFEAIGARNVDPERAIKAYVKAWRQMHRDTGEPQ